MIKEATGQIEEDQAIRADFSHLTDPQKETIKLFMSSGDKFGSFCSAHYPLGFADSEKPKAQRASASFFSKPVVRVIISQIERRAIREAQLQYDDIIESNVEDIIEAQKDLDTMKINSLWVLKRVALLADFNIAKFIKVSGDKAYYDFSQATDDDWYCISEYAVDVAIAKVAEANKETAMPVEKMKIKSYDKLRALELVGKHMDVDAFRTKVQHIGDINNPVGVVTIAMDAKDASSAYQNLLKDMSR